MLCEWIVDQDQVGPVGFKFTYLSLQVLLCADAKPLKLLLRKLNDRTQ